MKNNVFLIVLLLLTTACRDSTLPGREPLGETFPSAVGESLDGETVRFPEDLLGEPSVLLLGYVQDAQFDADRWLYGLLQADLDLRVLEVPTIKGLVPGAIRGTIDEGMRSGIPSEDWGSVVTLYGKRAAEVVALTGNRNPRNVRVILLDEEGTIRWFHDRGFSAGVLIDLERAVADLRAESPEGGSGNSEPNR